MKRIQRTYVAILALLLLGIAPLLAADGGLSVETAYPSIEASSDGPIDFDLKVQTDGQPSQRVDLSVDGLPDGWDYRFVGDGKTVDAVFVHPDRAASATLQVFPSSDTPAGTYDFTVSVTGEDGMTARLRLTVSIEEPGPAPRAPRVVVVRHRSWHRPFFLP
jgi:hypothetical protein